MIPKFQFICTLYQRRKKQHRPELCTTHAICTTDSIQWYNGASGIKFRPPPQN